MLRPRLPEATSRDHILQSQCPLPKQHCREEDPQSPGTDTDDDPPCSPQVEFDALSAPVAIRIAYSQRHMQLHSTQGLQRISYRIVLRGGSAPKT